MTCPSPRACRLILILCAGVIFSFAGAAIAETNPPMPRQIEADWLRQARTLQATAPAASTGTGRSAAVTALRGVVTTAQDAAGGCDGIKNGLWGFHVASGQAEPWWQVDLGKATQLDRVVIYNRCDSRTSRTQRIRVLVAEVGDDGVCTKFREVYRHAGPPFGGVKGKPLTVSLKDKNVLARIVRLHIPGQCSFALDEVEVYAADNPKKNIALGKPADQISVGPYSFAGAMPEAVARKYGGAVRAGSKKKPAKPQAAVSGIGTAQVKTVLARARALAARLGAKAEAGRLGPLCETLAAIEKRAEELGEGASGERLREVYLDACRLKRQIAFCNPLLDMDRILFIKRHDAGGPFHMCDQYYGCNAKPGGGLFVLEKPFSDRPCVRDLLADAVVQKGRLEGTKLTGGSFLSPEVSYDGKTILFAYSECQAPKTYQWADTYCYHIFKVGADGRGLEQITDGAWDDFDPCFLPSGRVAFVTLRRGGFLRCGRHCPVYTMFSMEPDGSDIVPLSYHETHEWQPSVNNDGMIVYTRWDYVDRDTNIAHHIWTCYPDGRDPRSFHGNYPVHRESRPWMEMSIRAIPDSTKYVATTGAHHGHAFGSLVMIDPGVEDDHAMSQLTRLTPDCPFPEAEGGKGNIRKFMQYATAWPLSEDDYLCVYDAGAKNHGIYWIDRFGNRELLYRDPKIACLSPIPLRARPQPAVIPDATAQTARARAKLKALGKPEPKASIAVMNVYDADFTWPKGTTIKALRIVQVLPKSTAPPNQPRIGVANQSNARAVLGTVPVEEDGSCLFEAPPAKALYFQALDEKGLAVMSMRSATYLHRGERLTCRGCHERKRRSSAPPKRLPLALQKPPHTITPEVEGANPFSFPRLVQPVLDKHCVACHTKNKAKAPNLAAGPPGKRYGWTPAYQALAPKYGFYFHVTNGSINQGVHGGSRTIPGQFGAKASKLYQMLAKGHHKLKLPPEDLRRLTLWLDCNSEFYGSYEHTRAQALGKVVAPTLE